ncbi:hypothetical protein OsI_12344 [Oryza sativa Indica Group]|uniref:ACB domain-containing protein n=1 Tax=Oryza sativa subsp. indica TaxID=39946 RepID=A2XIT4_ORYSI|nr:hypothetical protein OsI_12344 [Oryza sativa Indica Group]
MGLQEDFEEYAEKVKTLPESTSNEDKLILYGLYKQATVGDVNTCKSKEEAMSDYITKVKQLQEEAAALKAHQAQQQQHVEPQPGPASTAAATPLAAVPTGFDTPSVSVSVEISRKFDRNILQTCKFSGHGCPEKLPGQKSSNSSEFLVAGAH